MDSIDLDSEIERITNHLKSLDEKQYTAENSPIYIIYQDTLNELKELKKKD